MVINLITGDLIKENRLNTLIDMSIYLKVVFIASHLWAFPGWCQAHIFILCFTVDKYWPNTVL